MKLFSFTRTRPRIPWIFWALVWLITCLAQPTIAQEKNLLNDMGMAFILVEPGTFTMGSPSTEPFRNTDEIQRSITFEKPFYLQTTEVTLKQWQSVMGKKWFMKRRGSDDSPVTRVSYFDCLKFIDKLNQKGMGVFRLPTEAEWEYACRAGTTTAYSVGDTLDCSQAMYGNNTKKDKECMGVYESMNIPRNGPAPVKTFAPNVWGFYDMHGNVWEWCADIYNPNLSGTGISSGRDSKSRIRRGGSWYKHGHYLRSANRTYAHPGSKFTTTGFRLVREAD